MKNKKQSNKLTGDEAVRLAEWLGFGLAPCDDQIGCFWFKRGYPHVNDDDDQKSMKEWLSSAEGERALMDRLPKFQYFVGVEFYIPPDEDLRDKGWSCAIRMVTEEEVMQCGDTRILALQRATIRALEASRDGRWHRHGEDDLIICGN